MLWGAFSGDWSCSLGVALFFELFWLDLFPAGTYIPPHIILPTLLVLSLGKLLGFSSPWAFLPMLALAAPLAWVGAKAESWQRVIQNGSFNKLLHWAREDTVRFRPKTLIFSSLMQIMFLNMFVFVLSFCVLFVILEKIMPVWSLHSYGLKWPHLWMLALVGAISGLRLRKAYAVLFIGACVLVVLNGLLR